VTIDLDGFDPSIMPATGTPEPGGLSYYEVINLMRKLIVKKKLVGFDVVELCPNENNKASDFLATKLIYQILSFRFKDNE
jgi:agmatinase